MIAVDTSALMAILLMEKEADSCIAVLEREERLVISAVTVAEALIVANGRNLRAEMTLLMDGLGFEVQTVTGPVSRRVSEAYAVWGKGVHRAALNFGDCFAYDVAKENRCALLCIGDDFRRTDVVTVP